MEGACIGVVKCRAVVGGCNAILSEQSKEDHEIFRVGHLPRATLLVYSDAAVGSVNTKHGSARVIQRNPHPVLSGTDTP